MLFNNLYLKPEFTTLREYLSSTEDCGDFGVRTHADLFNSAVSWLSNLLVELQAANPEIAELLSRNYNHVNTYNCALRELCSFIDDTIEHAEDVAQDLPVEWDYHYLDMRTQHECIYTIEELIQFYNWYHAIDANTTFKALARIDQFVLEGTNTDSKCRGALEILRDTLDLVDLDRGSHVVTISDSLSHWYKDRDSWFSWKAFEKNCRQPEYAPVADLMYSFWACWTSYKLCTQDLLSEMRALTPENGWWTYPGWNVDFAIAEDVRLNELSLKGTWFFCLLDLCLSSSLLQISLASNLLYSEDGNHLLNSRGIGTAALTRVFETMDAVHYAQDNSNGTIC